MQINVSKTGKEDRYLFDVYVSLNSTPHERLIMEIKMKQTMADFFRSVKEALESKYNNLNGLKKLRIKDMKVVNFHDVSVMKQKDYSIVTNVNEIKNYKRLNNTEDELCYQNLHNNAHVLVWVESQDIWLSSTVYLRSPDFLNYEAKFEIKVDMNLSGRDLQIYIQKLVISIWNNLCQQNQLKEKPRMMYELSNEGSDEEADKREETNNNNKLYVLTQIEIFRNSNFTSNSKALGEDQVEESNINMYRFKRIPIDSSIEIQSMFDFENNEIVVECNFESVKRFYESMLDSRAVFSDFKIDDFNQDDMNYMQEDF